MPRTATAVAAEDHVILEQITNEEFEDYLKNHPENLQPIMSSVSGRIRELTEDLSTVIRITNEVLHERENGNSTIALLAKLFAKVKVMKTAGNEFSILRKRKQALSGEIPPVIHFHAGDVIFRAGDQADCMYDINEGSVGIYSDYQTENEKLHVSLRKDDVFGEMGILDDMPRSATAVCLSDCVVLVVKPENFMAFFQNKPMKILQILMQMCLQLRNLTQIYLKVCKTLDEIPSPYEKNFPDDKTFATLEQIRQTQLCAGLYDISFCRDYWYDHF